MPLNLPNLPTGWCCYLLLCEDGSYYCGLSGDLNKRVVDHASGKGSKYTKGSKPAALVWYEAHPNRERAAHRQREIKKWGRMKKELMAKSGARVSLIRPVADSG